jgi:hypothetical protein
MTRIAAVVLSLFAALSLEAQPADLRVTIQGDLPTLATPGTVLQWTATVENLGPELAEDVRFVSDPHCFDTTLAELLPGQVETRPCSFIVPDNVYSVLIVAAARSALTDDPNFENNAGQRIVDVVTPPDLTIQGGFGLPADPGLPFDVFVGWGNRARTAATNVTVTVTVPEATGFADLPANCTADRNRAICSLGTVPGSPPFGQQTGGQFTLHPIAPASERTAVPITAIFEIRSDEDDYNSIDNIRAAFGTTFRTTYVTNAHDSGPDSLRAAIEETNAACQERVPCKIAFRVLDATSVVTIRPVDPLPEVRSKDISIDGTTQTRYVGDANPQGPEIEISGSRAASHANGLVLRGSCGCEVRGLTINGFPGNGILMEHEGCSSQFLARREIAGNYIGTDPTGTRAIPNQRGIWLATSSFSIYDNLISGNGRSGIFVEKGSGSICTNVIGLNASLTAGLGNGASGIYVASPASDIADNSIGFNAHFGVSIAREAHHVSIRANSFQANSQLAIDYGLDGVTSEVPDMFGGGMVRAPEITVAAYDPVTNKTVLEGRAVRRGETTFVHLYANDAPDPSGFGEGQYFLGTTTVDQQGHFRVEIHGRLPGPWVAGTVTQYTILGLRGPKTEDFGAGAGRTTSEFGRTVRVTE